MIFRFLYIKALACLLPLSLAGQTFFNGVVCNTNKEPLAFAHISVLGKRNIGTVANGFGSFTISTELGDIIVISHLGYKDLVVSTSLRSDTLFLQTDILSLDQVTITPESAPKRAEDFVRLAIKRIPSNYDTNPHVLRSYYRLTNTDGKRYVRFLDAAVSIYEPGVDKVEQPAFNVDEVRSSIDNRRGQYIGWLKEMTYGKTPSQMNELKLKELKSKAQSTSSSDIQEATPEDLQFFESKASWNALWHFYYVNYIRNREKTPSRNHPFNGELQEDFIDLHKFKIDSIIAGQSGESIYVIKILPSSKSPEYMFQKGSIPVGRLYIRDSDYAILQMDYSYIINPKSSKFNHWYAMKARGTTVFFKTSVRYKEAANGLLYPSYLYKWEYDKQAYQYGGFNNKENPTYYFVESEWIINEVIFESAAVEKIFPCVNCNENLFESKRSYNADFWKMYPILKETTIQEKLRRDLEVELSLEEQFKKAK